MNSVIVSEFGSMLGKTSERPVVRGPRPRLEPVEGGPRLFLPLDLPARPPFRVVTSEGVRSPVGSLRPRRRTNGDGAAPRAKPEQVELPLFRVSEIIVAGAGISISTDLIEECCERSIHLSFLTPGGRPFAMLSSPMLTATVLTRREQMGVYGDRRGLELAKAIVRGKLGNQAALLKSFGKYLKTADPAAFERLAAAVRGIETRRREVDPVTGERVDDARPALLAIEGGAGRQYWTGVRTLLEGHAPFETREHRGAPDEVNSALNYGYGILYTQVWGPS